MRIIHGKGYSEADQLQFKGLVFRNILTAVEALITAMDTLSIHFEDSRLVEDVKDLKMLSCTYTQEEFSAGHKKLIARVWSDNGIQQCYKRRREYQIYQLSDSAK